MVLSLGALLLVIADVVPTVGRAETLIDNNGRMLFATAARLNEATSSDLEASAPQGGWSTFRRLLENHGSPQGTPSKCLRPPIGDVFSPAGEVPRQGTFVTEIQHNPVAVAGRVEKLTPGWNFDSNSVATLIRVRIDDVLKDPSARLGVGHVVTYLRTGGSLHASGRTICTENSEYSAPEVGDRLIVLGTLDNANDRNLMTHPSLVYYVRGSEVRSGDTRADRVRRLSLDDVQAVASSFRR